jgi:hypothetical protein
LYEDHADELDDTDYLAEAILSEIQPGIPDLAVISPKIKVMLGLARGWSRLVRRDPPIVGEIMLHEIVGMLADGYRTYRGRS